MCPTNPETEEILHITAARVRPPRAVVGCQQPVKLGCLPVAVSSVLELEYNGTESMRIALYRVSQTLALPLP